MNRKLFNIVCYVLICAVLFGALYYFTVQQRPDPISYSEAITLFEDRQVKSFSTKDDKLTMKLHTPYNGQS